MEISIIEEKPISISELKEYLDEKKKGKKELNFRENKSLVYINSFIKLKDKEASELRKELEKLEIARLKEKNIIKIVDLLPGTLDELKLILIGEELTLKTEDLNKIIDIIKKYSKK